MSSTRRGFLKMLGAAAASPALFPMNLKAALPTPPVPHVPGAPAAAEAIPELPRSISIFALPGNTGKVYLGPTAKVAKDRSKAMVLEPGSFVILDIYDISQVSIDLEIAGDFVHIQTGDHFTAVGGGMIGSQHRNLIGG